MEDEEPPFTKVVVVSAMQDGPCLADGGDKLHYLSILNKQVRVFSCTCTCKSKLVSLLLACFSRYFKQEMLGSQLNL